MPTVDELQREIDECRRVEGELRKTIEQLGAGRTTENVDLGFSKEEALQLAAIVESSEDAIIGCTLSGFVTIWNQGAERLFGYSADEIIGEPTTTNARLHWPDELKAMKRVRLGEYVPPF